MDQIDHAPWSILLQKYVDARGDVDYTDWKASRADVHALDAYLAILSRADRQLPARRAARLAFWINAYNALTVRGILREYPTSSIRNHTAKLYGYNIWHDLLLTVGGKEYSLDAIEHQVLRKMNEPRIHFAIVCASHSCPRLLNTAYEASKLEDQLVGNTRAFFTSPGNFRFDSKRGRVYLSSILRWFADDFGPDRASQLRTLAPYLPSKAAYQAAVGNQVTVSYLKYDWRLNDQATAAERR